MPGFQPPQSHDLVSRSPDLLPLGPVNSALAAALVVPHGYWLRHALYSWVPEVSVQGCWLRQALWVPEEARLCCWAFGERT